MPAPDACLRPSPHLTPSQYEPWLRARLERCSPPTAPWLPLPWGFDMRREPQPWATTHRHAVFLWFLLKSKRRQPFELYSSTANASIQQNHGRFSFSLASWDEERSLQGSVRIFIKKQQHHVHVRRAVTIAIPCPSSTDRRNHHPSQHFVNWIFLKFNSYCPSCQHLVIPIIVLCTLCETYSSSHHLRLNHF